MNMLRLAVLHRASSHCLGLLLAATFCATASLPASAAIRVDFDQAVYAIAGLATFDVVITIDGDDATGPLEPVPNGLFAYSIEMTITPAGATAVPGVTVTPLLDFSGSPNPTQAPAIVTTASGIVRITGNVDFSSDDYMGTVIATISLTDLTNFSNAYDLSLAIYETGPDPQISDVFIDGVGTTLDDVITFGTAQVVVFVPIDSPAMSFGGQAIAMLLLIIIGRRRASMAL